jgi:hypothetical protein
MKSFDLDAIGNTTVCPISAGEIVQSSQQLEPVANSVWLKKHGQTNCAPGRRSLMTIRDQRSRKTVPRVTAQARKISHRDTNGFTKCVGGIFLTLLLAVVQFSEQSQNVKAL